MQIRLDQLTTLGYPFTATRGFYPCGHCQHCLDGCGAEGHCKDGNEPLRGVLITIDGTEYALYGSADNQGRETVLFDDYPQVYQRIRAKIRHVLWVSRHPLGDEQRASLQSAIEASYLSSFSPSKPVIIDVTQTNITFTAQGVKVISEAEYLKMIS